MPRKLSSIAPDWWDYTTLDEEIIQAPDQSRTGEIPPPRHPKAVGEGGGSAMRGALRRVMSWDNPRALGRGWALRDSIPRSGERGFAIRSGLGGQGPRD